MAISINGTKYPQTMVEDIFNNIFLNSETIAKNLITIDTGHKSDAHVTEAKVAVTASALNLGQVSTTGNISAIATTSPVSLTTFNYEDVLSEDVLKKTRFESTMARGAFNNVSEEFDRKVLVNIAPAIAEDIDQLLWDGATSATKTAVASSSATAANKAIVAAMPTTQFDSLAVKSIYNDSLSKVTPGAGLADVIQTGAPAVVTAATIAAEYQKMIGASNIKAKNDKVNPQVFFVPFDDRDLIHEANNSATNYNKQFIVTGEGDAEVIKFQGRVIEFVPLKAVRFLSARRYLMGLTDLTSDVAGLIVMPEANASTRTVWKNIQTWATHIVNQAYVTVHIK